MGVVALACLGIGASGCGAPLRATTAAAGRSEPSRGEALAAGEADDRQARAGEASTEAGLTHSGLGQCAVVFEPRDRGTWHSFDGERYFVDAEGRPSQAHTYLPPVEGAPRQVACQWAVGRWGDTENPSEDYDGGHLIGSQLGGYGGRLNLVPQDLNFNRGNWAQIENQAARCDRLPPERLFYYVRATYADASTLIPESFTLIVQNRDTDDALELTFDNAHRGGPKGTLRRAQAVEFLKAQGCG